MNDISTAIPDIAPSVLNNPFKKDCGVGITIYCHDWTKFKWKGKIEFKSGNTTGNQAFSDYDSPYDILDAMKAFIDTLDNTTK